MRIVYFALIAASILSAIASLVVLHRALLGVAFLLALGALVVSRRSRCW